jgi:Flp pilus assembly protein TadD
MPQEKTKRTAAEVYDERDAAITAVLNRLQDGLAAHRREAHADPKNWGFVGDLGYVLDRLDEAVSFIRGEG